MIHVLYVGLGGFFGALSRYAISQWVKRQTRANFPIGTLLINLLGAFCLGLLSHFTGPITLLLGTGFLGAFTTFSTFKLESVQHHMKSEWAHFILYSSLTYILGIALAYLGMSL